MAEQSARPATDTDTDTDTEVDHPVFAALYDLLPDSLLLRPHREYLARDLSGRVLEIGPGSGPMFPYVADGAADDHDLAYHAVEPDPNMRKRAAETAREAGLSVELRDARAEALPYPDDSFDAVVSALVFCTVQDPDAALAEIARVLRPDGEFRFLEHVHADGWRGTGQNLLNPLWNRASGGCNLTRETIPRFVGHDAFGVTEIERLEFGFFPVTPVVRGTLRRRRGSVRDRCGDGALGSLGDLSVSGSRLSI